VQDATTNGSAFSQRATRIIFYSKDARRSTRKLFWTRPTGLRAVRLASFLLPILTTDAAGGFSYDHGEGTKKAVPNGRGRCEQHGTSHHRAVTPDQGCAGHGFRRCGDLSCLELLLLCRAPDRTVRGTGSSAVLIKIGRPGLSLT